LTDRIQSRILKRKSKSDGNPVPVHAPELEILDKRSIGRGVSYLIIKDGVEVWRARSSLKKCHRPDLDRFDKLYESILKDQLKTLNQNEKMIENEPFSAEKDHDSDYNDTESQIVDNMNEDFSMTEEDSQ